MDRQSYSQPAPAPACGAACPRGRPRGSKNRPRTQLKGSNANTQASQGISISQSPLASQARNSSLNPRQKPLSRPATKVSYTKVIRNNEVTYTSTVYPVVTWPRTLDPRVATYCFCNFDTSYEPSTTTKEPSVPMSYATIDNTSATKRDPTFYTKVPIPCVEPASQDAAVPAKGRRQLTNSECKAFLNCLNGGMAVWYIASKFRVTARYIGWYIASKFGVTARYIGWYIASKFGVTARYIGGLSNKYGNTRRIAESVKAKRQPKLLQPVHIKAIKQWVVKDCHLDTLAVQPMLATEFGLSVSKTLSTKQWLIWASHGKY
ncbi:hypothetical protein DSO57_1005256 [Entomophthora muscae]|uniref:Uncharacterized protein n=1 Tax=Entomophthora muscae TaxID=34485 RepID=A0ACC2SXG7_9FUNG|nr:hypothetical protein DSO57_1005256 [Entomophthora muscae]